jgi:hypothetical protein
MGFDENSAAGLRVRSVVVLILLRAVAIESLINNETR